MNINSQVIYYNLISVKHVLYLCLLSTMLDHCSNYNRLCMTHMYPSHCFADLNCRPVSPGVFLLSSPHPLKKYSPVLHHRHQDHPDHPFYPYRQFHHHFPAPEQTVSAVLQNHRSHLSASEHPYCVHPRHLCGHIHLQPVYPWHRQGVFNVSSRFSAVTDSGSICFTIESARFILVIQSFSPPGLYPRAVLYSSSAP